MKRTEEEVSSRGEEGDHEPETQFSLDSLDIIKVSHHVSRILYGWTLKRYHITYPLTLCILEGSKSNTVSRSVGKLTKESTRTAREAEKIVEQSIHLTCYKRE